MSSPACLQSFLPAVRGWFAATFPAPTACQARAWPRIQAGGHALIAAPTGSGKTLAAFLAVIDELVREAQAGPLDDAVRVVYVSPLKALSYDVERNLEAPLRGIATWADRLGAPAAAIRSMVRTGDTPATARQAMARQPPHILVTTPESLYILLGSESGRAALAQTHTVIVDEIHAVAGNKRGSHLTVTLERLESLTADTRPDGLRRIGLSATQRPMDLIADFLVGRRDAPCTVIDEGFHRTRDVALEMPASPLEPVMSAEVWAEVYDRIAELARAHRTTLVFANTRRLVERAALALAERLGDGAVASHHGSLSRERRWQAEQRLKAGSLTVLVATASLELGIDIGDVDLVCQLGSTRAVSTFLQRVGRSGHGVEATPKGRLFPLSRDDLVECAALMDAVRRGELDSLAPVERPLDVLAQHIVGEVACREWETGPLLDLLRRAWPYRDLDPATFESVVDMLATGFTTRRGRRGAFVHWDRVNGRLRARRGARMTALLNAGTIPENADYGVILEPGGTTIGTVNEDFAIESLPGDVFQLGLHSWRILRVEFDRIRVEDAGGQPPTMPFWLGEAPARSTALSAAVSRLRATVGQRIRKIAETSNPAAAVEAVADSVGGAIGLPPAAARQLVEYLAAGQAALGAMPTADNPVIERFFDEAGGMQLVVHSPLGGRVNRAWGLALRKRFCRRFNFELQAAATEDAIVLSLGETHSFALAEVASYLHSRTARDVLTQALLDSPIFPIRWRWNANVSLAVPRWAPGRKVPAPIQRMQAEDLVSVVFPDQTACAENVTGARDIPDHPLVRQTIHDALHDVTDVDGLTDLLQRIERGAATVHVCDLPEPSPFAHEILNAKPYAFLDDAPLEERRTRAVSARRWLDPAAAADLGRLDADAVERVRAEAWPDTDGADALHDALVTLGFLTRTEMQAALGLDAAEPLLLNVANREPLATLVRERRAGRLVTADPAASLWIAAERVLELQVVRPDAEVTVDPAPGIAPPATPEDALKELLRGRLGGLGPVPAARLATDLRAPLAAVEGALAALEREGFVLRGRFTAASSRPEPRPGPALTGEGKDAGESSERRDGVAAAVGQEWCERRLLARIHRYTLARLRREIEPVSPAEYMRFLFAWHGLEDRREGPAGLRAVLEQLEGFEASAAAWEDAILPARLRGYDPGWLDTLCLTGRVMWLRRTAPPESRAAATAATRIAFMDRGHVAAWRPPASDAAPDGETGPLSSCARRVHTVLRDRGAQFFDDLKRQSGLLPAQLEDGLAELTAAGLVTADGFSGLRALLKRNQRRGRTGRRLHPFDEAGRWALVDSRVSSAAETPDVSADPLDRIVDVLLRRYGVVFRKVLTREAGLPAWRDLLRVLRRREDRGEVRGGRFVAGFSGEQYALPDAVGQLRRIHRQAEEAASDNVVRLSAADPLNLTGIITPGERIASGATREVVYRAGEPVTDQNTARNGRVPGQPAFRVGAEPRAARRAVSG